jgi:hypothetical protein
MFIVPSTPKEGVKIKFTKAADGGCHLALKRLPPHLPVGHDFQSDAFLQSDGVIDGAIFDLFELGVANSTGGELFLSRKQFRRPKQATNYVGMDGDHSF